MKNQYRVELPFKQKFIRTHLIRVELAICQAKFTVIAFELNETVRDNV